jgi:hypothetical protein
VNTKQTTAINKQQLPITIKGAIEALKEHWVFDTVQLLNNCAVALERITRLLTQLERRSDWLNGHEPKIMKEISEFVLFIKEWETLAHERLTDALVCPDEIEFRLESLLKATNMPERKQEKMRRHWSTEDNLSSLEPPIVEIARRYWD